MVANVASAAFAPTSGYEFRINLGWGTDPLAICVEEMQRSDATRSEYTHHDAYLRTVWGYFFCRWKQQTIYQPGVDLSNDFPDLNGARLTARAALLCPANSKLSGSQCVCSSGYVEDATHSACIAAPEPERPVNSCRAAGEQTPNPILASSAEKYRNEIDLFQVGPAPLGFSRGYRSGRTSATGVLGKAWSHNHSAVLGVTSTDTTGAPTAASISMPDGYARTFTLSSGGSTWVAAEPSADTLARLADGSWTYRRAGSDATLTLNGAGKLQSEVDRNGWTTTYSYNAAGQLSTISNPFGRTLTLSYNGAGQLVGVGSSDGRNVAYGYDASGRLSAVAYPDSKTRTFLYENTAFPYALTGILDEAGVRWGTFAYDTLGRAVSSELAGAADRYLVGYPTAGAATITDPLGTARTYGYSFAASRLAVTSGSLPTGTDGSDAASRVQDTNGLITSESDFKGGVTTTTWDAIRRLPLTVTRGSGTPEAVTTTAQWHGIFSLPALVTEPGRTTSFSYDGVGNLLSKTITDTGTSSARTWSWTYNAQQLVATATEPNGAVTTYAYDAFGNALTSTNALGHVTSYTYDTANRVTSTTAPNGVVTAFTYDPRDRVLSRTVGGLPTVFTYNPTGTLASLTLPTGLVLTYTYDPAHRLTGWSNNRGESGTFTLDGMGNRTAEQIKDASGSVAWSVARSINNINRVYSKTEGSNQVNVFGYDANGELTSQTNGLNQSTRYGLDSLRRVASITDAANATATLTRNGLDDVTQAKDFKGAATTYARDALGNATSEASADSGARSTQYDALGLPSQIVDALGQATVIQRDPLGRPTSLTFADGNSTLLSYDLGASSKGYLSQIVDRSGTTEYLRDALGRAILKRQMLVSGMTREIGYSYLTNGLLASITYPAGAVLSYGYDATGRLSQLSWNGTPLVSAIGWNPLGQPTGWSWSFVSPGLNASRSYDTAGRLTATEFSSYVYNAAGRITSLSQQLLYPADSDPAHSTIASGNATWAVSYDAVGRIVGFNVAGGGDTAGFTYDANGNRASSIRTLGGQSISRSYTIDAAGNKLTGFSQSIGGSSSTSVAYGYNANGDLTGDGLRTFTYNPEGRLSSVTTGANDASPSTRYAYNALGQRVFKTEPQYPPAEGDEADPGFWSSLMAFFQKMWAPPFSDSDKLGYGYFYDEEGTLLAEVGAGGAQSGGNAQYIYLPTASGPLPVAVVVNGTDFYAVHLDHLNTPRRLTDASGQAVWQWAYSAFGEEKPTLAKNRFANLDIAPNPGTTGAAAVNFNLRYPGQYFDAESGLHYNYFRSYDPRTGRYSQTDPIGLDGGWNRFGYVGANPLRYADPRGLFVPALAIPLIGGGITVGDLGIGAAIGGAMLGLDRMLNDAAPEPPVPGAIPHSEDPVTGSGTRQWEKPGTAEDADRDFDACRPSNVQDKGRGVRVGTLPNGDRIIVRPDSGSGQPTIEVQRPDGRRSRDKVRYGP
jgi:RHS repeat-associated protein